MTPRPLTSLPGPPVVIDALRTPIGTAGRSLAAVPAFELAAPLLRRLAGDLRAQGLEPAEVVLGNCTGPGGNIARVAALAAGIRESVPALTIDRQCASGLAAIDVAAAMLRGRRGAILAGGTESASTAPWRFWPPTGDSPPERYHRAPFAPPGQDDPEMGLAADLLAEDHGIGRVRQDAYAARSHRCAVATARAGGFQAEIVPTGGVAADERPRERLDAARLARLRPAFRPEGSVTAGNSCGINDGAAAVALVDAETHGRLGVPGLQVLATATCGVAPGRPGIGLVPAVRSALEDAGLTLAEIDVIEINEAFAGQVLACCDELGLDPERVCREGGALALGHPWGASGAVLLVRLFSQLIRAGAPGRHGLAAIAAGGGQGVAMVVRACP